MSTNGRVKRSESARRVLAVAVLALTMAAVGTRAAPVSAQVPTLWGIDACDPAPTAVPDTQSALGNPQFMARYLGSNRCKTAGLSSSEVSYLSSQGIYIMLMADPDSFGTGTADAQTAIQQAQSLGAPPGTAIFRDVENSDPITVAYIESWYQAFAASTSGRRTGLLREPLSQRCDSVSRRLLHRADRGARPEHRPRPLERRARAGLWRRYPAQRGERAGMEPVRAPLRQHHGGLAVLRSTTGVPPAYSAVPVDVDEFNTAYESLLWNGPKGPGVYTALQPYRICDTRSVVTTGYGTECSGTSIGQGSTLDVQITGVNGPSGQSVPSDAQAVVLNVTAIDGSAGTFLTVYPAGSAVPNASNLNVPAHLNEANLVVAALGSGGQVSLYNSQGSINVAIDVEGYFAAASGSSPAGLFHPIAPLRICDTRQGRGTECSGASTDNLLGQSQWTRVVVSGCPTGSPSCTASVPTDGTAEAVALNLTAVYGSSFTYLSVVPPNSSDQCPSGTPAFSNLNLNAHNNLPNRVIVPLGPEQDVCVYNSLGSINFILDVNGWFGDGSETSQGAYFFAIPPLRICDTRAGTGTECSGTSLGPGQSRTIPVAGVDGLPTAGGTSPPAAVIANVTAVFGTASTYFTLYPSDVSLPNASDLNVGSAQNTPNLVIVQLATTGANAGAVNLFNDQGTINAIVDIAGWFEA